MKTVILLELLDTDKKKSKQINIFFNSHLITINAFYIILYYK